MLFSHFLFSIITAVVVSGLTLCLLWFFRNKLPLAIPNHRSLHSEPIPCVAGLALWSGCAAGMGSFLGLDNTYSFEFDAKWWTLAAGWLILAAVSFHDDWTEVSPFYRLMLQLVAAILITSNWFVIESAFEKEAFDVLGLFVVPRYLAIVAIVLFIVWMINLFNFMDGSDGLATTMTAIGFSTLAIAALMTSFSWWWMPALVAASALPVGYVNAPPAKMFLGDVGAVPLGFLAAGFGGLGIVQHGWPFGFLLLTFLPFILDATVTLSWRILRREQIWEAHKTHYFQRLSQLGLGHRGVLGVYSVLMVGCAATALLSFHYHIGLYIALAFWIGVHALLFLAIDFLWYKHKKSVAHCKGTES